VTPSIKTSEKATRCAFPRFLSPIVQSAARISDRSKGIRNASRGILENNVRSILFAGKLYLIYLLSRVVSPSDLRYYP